MTDAEWMDARTEDLEREEQLLGDRLPRPEPDSPYVWRRNGFRSWQAELRWMDEEIAAGRLEYYDIFGEMEAEERAKGRGRKFGLTFEAGEVAGKAMEPAAPKEAA